MSTCPRGLINDPYPGQCGLYTDQNSDQICDLSQTQTQESQNPVLPLPASPSIDYLLYVCLILPIVAYIFTSKFKLFWNILLFVSFIPTAFSSLAYIFRFNSSQSLNLHLYFGTLMLSISLCHLFWHWRYYFKMTKKSSPSKIHVSTGV